jgi:hypothetical protein
MRLKGLAAMSTFEHVLNSHISCYMNQLLHECFEHRADAEYAVIYYGLCIVYMHCVQVPPLRREVSKFVKAVCNASDLTLQMFISCGGMGVRLTSNTCTFTISAPCTPTTLTLCTLLCFCTFTSLKNQLVCMFVAFR